MVGFALDSPAIADGVRGWVESLIDSHKIANSSKYVEPTMAMCFCATLCAFSTSRTKFSCTSFVTNTESK